MVFAIIWHESDHLEFQINFNLGIWMWLTRLREQIPLAFHREYGPCSRHGVKPINHHHHDNNRHKYLANFVSQCISNGTSTNIKDILTGAFSSVFRTIFAIAIFRTIGTPLFHWTNCGNERFKSFSKSYSLMKINGTTKRV